MMPPATHLDLCLHDDRAADCLGGGLRLLGRVGNLATGHGEAMPGEQLLALVLEEIHPRPLFRCQ